MSTTSEPPTLGPADVADQVPSSKKTRKPKAKIDRLLNPIANDLVNQPSLLLSEGVKLCGHLSRGEPVTEDKILTLERLVRADERFVVFIQDGKKHVALVSANPGEAQLERLAETVEVAPAAASPTPTLSEQLEKQAAMDQAAQQQEAAQGETPVEGVSTSAPVDTPAADVPTIGELASQVVAETKVMETISQLPTATERLQFELNCYMTRAAKVRTLGQHYQQLKSAQSELQGELTDIHKQLKDTAKKLADLAVERVDLTFQDPIPFATAPEDGATAADAGLKDEHGEPVTADEGEEGTEADPQQTIGLGNPDLTHLDNPGSGAEIPPPAAEEPIQFPLDKLAAATPAENDLDAPPNPVGSE